MSIKRRVEALENKIGTVTIAMSLSFGDEKPGNCKYFDRCQRIGNDKPRLFPEGTKIKFVVASYDQKNPDPCEGCTDYEKESRTEQEGRQNES